MSLEIYLIRHGETEVNLDYHQTPPEERRICGRNTWSELTKRGIKESRMLGEYLAGKIFDAFYSSPAVRTQQTARYCMQAMHQKWLLYEIDKRLAELAQGVWEGQLSCRVRPPPVWEEIEGHSWDFKSLKGESPSDVYERMRYFIEEKVIAEYLQDCESVRKYIDKYNKKDIIFTPKNAIACLLAPLTDFDMRNVHKMEIGHTSISVIKYHGTLEDSDIQVNLTPHFGVSND